MKLAFSAPTPDAEQTRQLLEQFRQVGFGGLQLKPAQFRDYLEEPLRLLETWPMLRGCVSGLITAGKLDEAGRAKLRKVLRFAHDVDAELVIFCHSEVRASVSDLEIARFADELDELGAEASDLGTKLSLHQHYNQPCMTRADLDIFFARQRSYGLTVDTAHLVKSGIPDVPEVIRAFSWAVDNFHMKDFAAGEFRVLGHGSIDFVPIFQALRQIGYTGWIAADEESGGDLLSGMKASYHFLHDQLNPPM